jgi:hypothetical protein
MSLEQIAHYNNLSTKLREELVEKLQGLGKRVRYKFDIGNPNPDPQKYNGAMVFPNLYTLDPCIFDILDPYEEKGKPKSKKIALVSGTDEKGIPNKFGRIRVRASEVGILDLDLTEGGEGWYTAMYLELHPKLLNGKFADTSKHPVVSRIDEVQSASNAKKERTARLKALNAAQDMTDKDIFNFADAMLWDSSEDILILRNKVEELADTNPEFFNDLVSGKTIEYKATIKKAMNKKVIEFDPAEYKFLWCGNKQTIAMLSPAGNRNEVDKFSEFLQTGGEKADTIYKKIKDLIK